MYEAVRLLSILKETLPLDEKRIAQVTADIEQLQQRKDTPSEISMIRNLHWWSVEYGLIGTLENPKIFGAGLLSSIGESKSCLSNTVKSFLILWKLRIWLLILQNPNLSYLLLQILLI